MPIYKYVCENCGEQFEARQSFSDEPLTVCPTCEGHIHRVIQPVGVVFKGSGFYVTDSRGKQNLATSGVKKDEAKGEDKAGDNGSSEKSSSDNGSSSASTKAAETTATAKADTSTKTAE
jgi:putative FmdB family regulatory protein